VNYDEIARNRLRQFANKNCYTFARLVSISSKFLYLISPSFTNIVIDAASKNRSIIIKTSHGLQANINRK